VVDLPTYCYDASGPLPAAESTYRLETTVDRSTGFDTSTVVHATWTFRSATAKLAHGPRDAGRPGPLAADPAPAGRRGTVRLATATATATATDNSGNTAEYSVLRAYRITGSEV